MPPAFGRLGARLEDVGLCTTAVRLPLTPELLLPDGRPSGAVTSLLADFALTTSVIASLPDLRGVTTVALTVDHLALPPTSGSLVSRCTAAAYDDGRPQHAAGALFDDARSTRSRRCRAGSSPRRPRRRRPSASGSCTSRRPSTCSTCSACRRVRRSA